jgi:hypothetical protein
MKNYGAEGGNRLRGSLYLIPSKGVSLNWLTQLDLRNFSKVSLILYSLFGAHQ